MIKQVFKSLFLVFVLLVGCEKEDFFIEDQSIKNQEGLLLKKVSFKEIKTRPKVFEKLNEFGMEKTGNSSHNRKVYYEEFGLFIDTTNIVYIEKEGKHSYTFKIVDEAVFDKIENLVLKSKEDGSYTAYIVEYLLSQEEQALIANGEKLTDKTPSSIIHFENMSVMNFSNMGNNCVEVYTYTINYCEDVNGNTIRDNGELGNGCVRNWHQVVYKVFSIDAGCLISGGGSGNSGSYNPGDGYYNPWYPVYGGPGGATPGNPQNPDNPNLPGNPGNNNPGNNPTPQLTDDNGNPIMTTPVLNVDANELHLRELNKITDQNETSTNVFRNKINEYVGMLNTAQVEVGVEYRKGMGGTYVTVEPLSSGFDYIEFADAAITTYLRIHLHHNYVNSLGMAIDPIPSDGDIFGFAKAYFEMGNSSGRNNFTSIIVSRNGLYAMRVKDGNKLLSFLNNLNNKENVDNIREGFYRYVTSFARVNCNDCTLSEIDEYLEILFVSFIKNQIDCGIDIYKGTLNNENNYNWNKL